ncbi:UbiA family prenyltransferase [Acidicapsa dinghuensis]|uniref:UbiA family prenyltransferase n=1 Tax=Acidicapsa dinghuensis TaxID=2218256 RepID=A0ABW1EEE7_9BACT|nr:UbiA family prenyltransferase [Acidicapsa dinghuensis]
MSEENFASQAAAVAYEPEAKDTGVPVCVDLDGTLVKSDTFYDSVCLLLRMKPASLLRFPQWLLSGGKARVKQEVNLRVSIDAAHLPYNQPLLIFLREQQAMGRPIYLTTGADIGLAERVAAHLGFFSGVLASDGSTNLTGNHKLAGLQQRFPVFDYIGNAKPDLPALAHARKAYLANPTQGLRMALKARRLSTEYTFEDRRKLLPAILKAVRTHQWAKNFLLLVPLLMSHQLTVRSVSQAITAFFCFSFVASANYLINDLLDMESDRRHHKKRFRPFAHGDLTAAFGAFLAFVAVAVSAAMLPFLPIPFALWLIVYVVVTSAYSFYFKRVPIVDVLVLSGLYTLRLMAGGAATQTPISPWLSSLSIFLFLSLAMVKRFSELANLRERGVSSTHGRGYHVSDMEQIRAFGTSSAYAAVVIFSLYISHPDVSRLYRHPGRLWLIVPLMLYWLTWVWLKASRGEMHEDPVIFAIRDRQSMAIAVCIGILALFAAL